MLHFQGDSDAHIVRGLIAILFAMYQDKTPEEILAADASAVFAELGLRSTSRRSARMASSPWWSASAATPAQLRLPRRHLMGKNHHATWGRHAMTPSVRARTSGEARHVATASVARRTLIGRDAGRRAVIGGAEEDRLVGAHAVQVQD